MCLNVSCFFSCLNLLDSGSKDSCISIILENCQPLSLQILPFFHFFPSQMPIKHLLDGVVLASISMNPSLYFSSLFLCCILDPVLKLYVNIFSRFLRFSAYMPNSSSTSNTKLPPPPACSSPAFLPRLSPKAFTCYIQSTCKFCNLYPYILKVGEKMYPSVPEGRRSAKIRN